MFDPFGDHLGREPENQPAEAAESSEPTDPTEPTQPTPWVDPAPPTTDPFAPPCYEPASPPPPFSPPPVSPSPYGAPPGSTWSRPTAADSPTQPPSTPPPTSTPSGHGGAQPPRRWSPVLAVLVAISLVLSGVAIARSSGHTTKIIEDGSNATTATVSTSPTVVTPSKGEEPVAAVASTLAPSVVQIETDQGLGSGFVYDTAGHILTAAHVVEGAGDTVTVRLANGATRTGHVVGADENTDVAVVKIDLSGTRVPPASLALNESLQVGQTAVAIGSPFGLEQTVTSGIVSAVDRAMQTPQGAIDMVQTDAPINPGNSGGPLADLSGRVIGINDQIESASDSSSGVGFAIPIGTAKAVADKLVAGEKVTFAFLGVQSEDSSQSIVGTGAIIISVENGSPADKAGIQQGDIITKVGATAVPDATTLTAIIRQAAPGSTVSITLERNGHPRTVSVTLGSTAGS